MGKSNKMVKMPLKKLIFLLILVVVLLIQLFSPNRFNFSAPQKPREVPKTINAAFWPKAEKPTVVTSLKKESSTSAYIPQVSGYQLRVPILMYHYIGNNPNPADKARDSLSVAPDKFDAQMGYLSANGYSPISLDTLYAALQKQVTLPVKPVVLTFDDGYMDFYINAYNILRKYNFHATVFIPTALMNQGYYLTWNQIREMAASGLITFGAHTVHHSNLPSLSSESAFFEISESKKVLQDQLGVPINFIAFPNGATNSTIVELTKKAGYIGAVGTWPGKLQSEGTIYNAPRLRVSGFIDLPTFISLL